MGDPWNLFGSVIDHYEASRGTRKEENVGDAADVISHNMALARTGREQTF